MINPQTTRNTKQSSDEKDKEVTGENQPPKKMSKMEEKRALAEEYEKKL